MYKGTVVACLALALLMLSDAGQSAFARSIYFPNVISHLKLDAQQRPKVQRILSTSEREARAAFAKHGISLTAKPEFDKLVKARHDLEPIQKRERNQLKKILTKEQLKIYDRIMKLTQARVIKATRRDAK